MNTTLDAPARPSIEWPKPIVNDPADALEQALRKIERLRSLMKSNNDDMLDVVLADEGTPAYASTVWEIYLIATEQLAEVDALVAEIIETNLRLARASVAKHVDIRQRHDWAEAAQAYRAAEEAPYTDDTFDAIGEAAAAAYQRMLNTRTPNLRCLHEKLCLINDTVGWQTDGTTEAIIADVEALARKYEITAKLADSAEG